MARRRYRIYQQYAPDASRYIGMIEAAPGAMPFRRETLDAESPWGTPAVYVIEALF